MPFDPAQMVADQRLDAVLRVGIGFQRAQDAGLVFAQDLDIERAENPVLVAEVVVNRADAGPGALPHSLDRDLLAGFERCERGLQNRLPARHR